MDDLTPDACLPLTLARLHRGLAAGEQVELRVKGGPAPLDDLLTGGGFEDIQIDDRLGLTTARRARTLPDFVGPGMRVLVCGLNPSLVAADAGFGYAGPTNRFWPAALAAGLVTRARDPFHALEADHVGMTDFVKRATVGAAELRAGEYRTGAERVTRLVRWLRPDVVIVVGLAGWRVGMDPRAVPGWQPDGMGGAKAYVLPSTSGRNAHTSLDQLAEHLSRALA